MKQEDGLDFLAKSKSMKAEIWMLNVFI